VQKFVAMCAMDIDDLRCRLKQDHKFDEAYEYSYSSLRSYPLIGFAGVKAGGLVCPLPTLLFRRFTSGLYYDLIDHPDFGNALGRSFQRYVGDVLTRANAGVGLRMIAEERYGPKAQRKDTVDWIAAEAGGAAIFLECKTKRLSLGAKSSLAARAGLEADIGVLGDAVVQLYKTIRDYRANQYKSLPFDAQRRVFPVVVTLENWFGFGPLMNTLLDRRVRERFQAIGLLENLLVEMPYTIIGCDELETAAQIWSRVGIVPLFSSPSWPIRSMPGGCWRAT
jgi:hypothetical protein